MRCHPANHFFGRGLGNKGKTTAARTDVHRATCTSSSVGRFVIDPASITNTGGKTMALPQDRLTRERRPTQSDNYDDEDDDRTVYSATESVPFDVSSSCGSFGRGDRQETAPVL